MNVTCCLLGTWLSLFAVGAGGDDTILPFRYKVQGKVVEVFDSGRILLSIGSAQGPQNGAKVDLYQIQHH